MGNRIHVRIFLPVLAAVILLSAAAWAAFSLSAGWYVEHTAEKKLTVLMDMIEEEARELYGKGSAPESGTKEEEREKSKVLLQIVRQNLREEKQEAGLMVLNSKKRQVYTDGGEEGTGLYGLCTDMLEDGRLSPGIGTMADIGESRFLIRLFEVKTDANVRARYFIGYIYVPDMSVWMAQAGNLLVGIAAVCLFLMGIIVWRIARGISAPLEELCRYADQIGNEGSAPISRNFSLLELERLKNRFNRMEERLKEAEEQKARFFQNVSHDLRTPLAAITGYAQGIQCGVMKEPQKAAAVILSESLRMTNLVESILTISKLDNHQLKLHRVPIELEEFLEEQIEIMRGMAGEKALELSRGCFELTVTVDPDLLARIVQNVISNCLRYASHRVEVCLTEEEGRAVVLVTDDGPGFGEEDPEHLFERFYQGENGEFGIGLSIARSGMEYMGGSIRAANGKPPRGGAVFRLEFPVLL